MKPNDASKNNTGEIGWHLLGELELPVSPDAKDGINMQLAELLEPLNLHTEFLNGILKSARDTLVRARQAGISIYFDHIHLLIFVPLDDNQGEKTWGYFRIEKIETISESMPTAAHRIEFYLYWEGLEGTL